MTGLLFAGCNDVSTPEGVLGTAWNRLEKEKVRAFKRTLRGSAREQYGNLVAMGELLQEIRPLELSVGDVVLTETKKDQWQRDVRKNYEVQVLARQRPSDGVDPTEDVGADRNTGTFAPFKTATVKCFLTYESSGACRPGDPLDLCAILDQDRRMGPSFDRPGALISSLCYIYDLRPAEI